MMMMTVFFHEAMCTDQRDRLYRTLLLLSQKKVSTFSKKYFLPLLRRRTDSKSLYSEFMKHSKQIYVLSRELDSIECTARNEPFGTENLFPEKPKRICCDKRKSYQKFDGEGCVSELRRTIGWARVVVTEER